MKYHYTINKDSALNCTWQAFTDNSINNKNFEIQWDLPALKEVEVEVEVEKGSECLAVDGPAEAAESNPRLAELDGDPLMTAEKVKKEVGIEIVREVC